MSDGDSTTSDTIGGGNDAPWTDPEVPCVYCGRRLRRDSQRCPHCKTSYSLAVRRASREIEGDWFYLEPRNPSNRGVDFGTMLKLIEKGRLRRDSVVRGPTTHQDWMYAAETPRLSKHLGVCPHCFAPASGNQEFCATCHRTLDERPARLKPGVSAAGAADRFADRAAMEEQLAEALKTHQLGRVATQMAQETAAVEEVVGQEAAMSYAAPPRPRSVRAVPTPRVKVRVVILLTAVTVIPLSLLMVSLPIENLFGNPDLPGSVAHNVSNNRQKFWRWVKGEPAPQAVTADAGERSVWTPPSDSAPRAPAAGAAAEQDRQAREAEAARQRELQKQQEAQQAEARRKAELDAARAMAKQIADACDAGNFARAENLLKGMSDADRAMAAQAGSDLAALDRRIQAGLQEAKARMERDARRRDVQNFLTQARNDMAAQKYDSALPALKTIRKNFTADDLPQGVTLAEIDTLIRKAENNGIDPEDPSAKPNPDKQKADQLWAEVKDLEAQKKYDLAFQKCQEIQKLPAEVQPKDLDAKMKDLKVKWFTGG